MTKHANYTLMSKSSRQRQQCACATVSLLSKCLHVARYIILYFFSIVHNFQKYYNVILSWSLLKLILKISAILLTGHVNFLVRQIPPSTLINWDVWTAVDQVQLLDTFKVIFVLGEGDCTGLDQSIVSDSNGLVWTTGSWKCNSVYFDGWADITFDDRTWPNARETYLNAGSQSSVRYDAYWIRTNGVYDIPIYCRINVNLGTKTRY